MSDIDPSIIAAVASAAANQKQAGGPFAIGEFLFALMTYVAAAVSIVFVVGCLTRLLP